MKHIRFTEGLILLVLLLVLLLCTPTKAQDVPVTACRDPRFFNPIRIEFHDIPLSYFVWNSDAPSWGYWAQGVGMYTDVGVMVADALDVDTDGYPAGTATFVVYGDAPYSVEGNADSPLCDVALSPVQDDSLVIVLTPEPTADPTEAALTGGRWAVDGTTGKPYYQYKTNGDHVPLPPASNHS